MKEAAQNTYIGGINRDKSKHLPNKDTMWDNKNFRVLTQEGDSSLALVNVKGNAEIFDNTGNTQLSTENGFSIIGHGVIRNDIILFAVKDDGDINLDILPTQSRLYLYKWDNNNNVFYPRITLYEDNNNDNITGLRLQNDIDTITRWETNYIQKVYWTDGVNNVRYVNISPDIDDTTGLPKEGTIEADYSRVANMDIEDFDIVQKMDLPKPSFEGYASGELYAGMLQFNYRFYNLYGGESMFGQAGDLIPIFSDDITNNSINVKGDEPNTNSKKTIKGSLRISGNNLNFDRVEIVSLWYGQLNGVPTINVIDIQKIDKSKGEYTINFEDTGTDYLDTISINEYRNIKNDYITKTFETKDDRMFLGNIKEKYFDVPYWDARAYRYNPYGNCVVYDKNGVGLVVTPSTYEDVPEDHDCINWYKNNLEHDEAVRLDDTLDYAYRSDGIRGGSGLNISYRFLYTPYETDNGESEIHAAFDYNSSKYKYQYGIYKGFQRDEIYRFGIVFFDNKGRQSFVKWISDIRMPRNDEVGSLSNIYPDFSIIGTLPKNDDNTDMSYQIVYVKRESKDKTILASGLLKNIEKHSGLAGWRVAYYMKEIATGGIPFFNNKDVISSKPNIGSSNLAFYSADIDYNNIDLTDTYLDIVADINDVKVNKVTTGTGLAGSVERFSGVLKYSDYEFIDSFIRHKIEFTTTVNNIPYNLTPHTQSGIWGKLTQLEDGNNITSVTGHINNNGSLDYYKPESALADLLYIKLETDIAESGEYGYIRRIIKGYGGDTYTDRQQNKYIQAGIVNDGACVYGDTYIGWHSRQYSGIVRAYNKNGEQGDILTTNREDLQSWYIYENFPTNMGSTINMLFPVETTVVLPLCHGDDLNKHIDTDYGRFLWLNDNRKILSGKSIDTSGWLVADNSTPYLYELDYDDAHLYNPVYSKVHDDKVFFPKPLDWQKQVHFDTRIRWSNPKINGEERDSWLMFLANNMQDVDNRYGSINQLVNFKNNLFAFQESGFCVLPVNERAITTGTTGSAVSLGEGSVLPKHMNYAAGSTVVGIQNNNKVIQSLRAMYWVDVNKKKFYRFAGSVDSLSDVKGLSAYFAKNVNDDTTFKGAYNNRYAEVMLTMNNTTLVLNEMIDAFQSWFTMAPTIYIKTPVKFLTTQNSKDIWEHDIGNYGSWYGNVFYSTLSLIINSTGSITKEFNNLQYMSESYDSNGEDNYYDTLNTVKGENDYQETEVVDLLPYNNGDTLYVGGLKIPNTAPDTIKNIRRRERIWNTTVPRVKLENANRDNPRLRDAYVKLTFEYFNADNFKFVLHNIITFFRNASKT